MATKKNATAKVIHPFKARDGKYYPLGSSITGPVDYMTDLERNAFVIRGQARKTHRTPSKTPNADSTGK